MAKQYEITGNVEIDDGFSFTYTVQVYFTVFYQKQVIESSFNRYNQMQRDPHQSTKISTDDQNSKYRAMINRLYEKFDSDFAQDFSEIQKRNLKSLLMVDFMLVDLQNTNADGASLPLLKKGKKVNE